MRVADLNVCHMAEPVFKLASFPRSSTIPGQSFCLVTQQSLSLVTGFHPCTVLYFSFSFGKTKRRLSALCRQTWDTAGMLFVLRACRSCCSGFRKGHLGHRYIRCCFQKVLIRTAGTRCGPQQILIAWRTQVAGGHAQGRHNGTIERRSAGGTWRRPAAPQATRLGCFWSSLVSLHDH